MAARLVERFNGEIASLSSSDILRRHIAQQTALGQRAKRIMDEGKLLDDATMTQLITVELSSKGWVSPSSQTPTSASSGHPLGHRHSLTDPLSGKRTFTSTSAASAVVDPSVSSIHSSSVQQSWLLDGFPRTLAQAQLLDTFLQTHNSPLNLVITLTVPPSSILSRITERYIHPASGRVYNLSYNPPKKPGVDDVTGEPLVKRTDDEEQVWRERVAMYEEKAGPLERWLERREGLVWRVGGATSDEIYPKIEAEVLRRFGGSDKRVEEGRVDGDIVQGVGL